MITKPRSFPFTPSPHKNQKVLGLMQVYGQAAKAPMIELLPALSAVASQQGPDLASLPKSHPRRASAGAGSSDGCAAAAAVAGVRPEFSAGYSDLRTAQVRCLNCLAVLFRHWPAELGDYQRPILDATFYLFRWGLGGGFRVLWVGLGWVGYGGCCLYGWGWGGWVTEGAVCVLSALASLQLRLQLQPQLLLHSSAQVGPVSTSLHKRPRSPNRHAPDSIPVRRDLIHVPR